MPVVGQAGDISPSIMCCCDSESSAPTWVAGLTPELLPHLLHFPELLMTSTAPYHVAPGTALLVSMGNELLTMPPEPADEPVTAGVSSEEGSHNLVRGAVYTFGD